ncbi:MAG: response regulator [Sulfurovum sp.]|nr:response regulator [Sulfurovum sp.]
MHYKKSIILIVDDEEVNRNILYDRIISMGHIPLLAENGKLAISTIEQQKPDLILLDIMMPVMDGYETLNHLKSHETYKNIPIQLLSAKDDQHSIVKGLELGADNYIVKPYNAAILKARISSSLKKKHLQDSENYYMDQVRTMNKKLNKLVYQQMKEIAQGHTETVFALCKLTESRDPETGEHLSRMREYSKALTIQLKKNPKYTDTIDDDFIDILYRSSPLHDIGKVGIPDYILNKPDKLTSDEFEIMKTHTEIGEQSLNELYQEFPSNPILYMGSQIAGKHHEKWDGTGYPSALKGENIPLAARVVALSDMYDALTSHRTYKEAFTYEKSKELILKEDGKRFDPDIIKAFLEIEHTFIHIHKEFST